jgi:hypothetical protein
MDAALPAAYRLVCIRRDGSTITLSALGEHKAQSLQDLSAFGGSPRLTQNPCYKMAFLSKKLILICRQLSVV